FAEGFQGLGAAPVNNCGRPILTVRPQPEMDMSAPKQARLPLGVMITAGYLILLGLVRLGGFVFSARPSSMSSSVIAHYVVNIGMAAMLVVAGAALFQRKRWSRRFALGVLGVVGYQFIEKGVLLFVYGVSTFF